ATTIGVDDDLPSGQAGVALRTAGDESSGRVDVELRVGVEQLRRNDGLDDVLEHGLGQVAVADRRRVLRGNDDRARADRPLSLVLDRDLRLAVRAKEVELV